MRRRNAENDAARRRRALTIFDVAADNDERLGQLPGAAPFWRAERQAEALVRLVERVVDDGHDAALLRVAAAELHDAAVRRATADVVRVRRHARPDGPVGAHWSATDDGGDASRLARESTGRREVYDQIIFAPSRTKMVRAFLFAY